VQISDQNSNQQDSIDNNPNNLLNPINNIQNFQRLHQTIELIQSILLQNQNGIVIDQLENMLSQKMGFGFDFNVFGSPNLLSFLTYYMQEKVHLQYVKSLNDKQKIAVYLK
jgi:hypothetical protein